MAEIKTYRDADHLARAAVEHFISLATESTEKRGRFAVALSGGSTPRATYALLASPEFAGHVDWTRVHLFWGDERCVPPDHPDSNFRMVNQTLLKAVTLPEGNVHRMLGEKDPGEAVSDYEKVLSDFFAPLQGGEQKKTEEPSHTFDLVLLGLGPDGHTASLFPASRALEGRTRWVAANYVDKIGKWRLTLTPEIINTAGQVIFLVSGVQKAGILREVLLGPCRPEELPAQLIKPARGFLLWLIDAQAGQLLE